MLYKNIVHIIQYNMVRPETIYTQTSKKKIWWAGFYIHTLEQWFSVYVQNVTKM